MTTQQNQAIELVTAQPVRFKTDAGEIAVSIDDVRNYLCPDANVREAFMFLQLCRYQGLNPYLREAYLVVYTQKDRDGNVTKRTPSMIVGKEAFTKRAERHPQFNGYQAGVILLTADGKVTYREGTFYLPKESLMGGWALVHRRDRTVAVRAEVNLREYDTGMSLWGNKKGTMIRKVALCQALREAFPDELGALYDVSEMGLPADNQGNPMLPAGTIETVSDIVTAGQAPIGGDNRAVDSPELPEPDERQTPPPASSQQRQQPPRPAPAQQTRNAPPNDRQQRIDAAAAMKEAREALGMSADDFAKHVQGQYGKEIPNLLLPEIQELTAWLRDKKAMQETSEAWEDAMPPAPGLDGVRSATH